MMKPLFDPRTVLAAALCAALPFTSAAQSSDPSKAKAQGASKVVQAVNADVIAARKANAEKRYGDAEALMLKDTTDHPELVVPRVELAVAEMALEKYDDAAVNLKKALDIDVKIDTATHSDAFYQDSGIQATHASRNTAGGESINEKNRDPDVLGLAWSSLGEIYIRQKHYREAQDAFDHAAQVDPAKAPLFLRNETVFFFKAGQADAQLAAAEKAIAADPTRASNYYFKGQALVQKATIDPQTQKMTLPPGCAEAYQKYLELEPNGQFSADAKGVLTAAGVQPGKKS
jgi:tetratricopeptide (TPR) repeat protein